MPDQHAIATTDPAHPDPADPGVLARLAQFGWVALGGAVGTLGRAGLSALIGDVAGLPLGILVINVTGALALGVLLQALALRGPDRGSRRSARLLLGTGVLGGFTTYSLLATDVAQLLLSGDVWGGLGYGAATLVLGGLATWAGMGLARALLRSRGATGG